MTDESEGFRPAKATPENRPGSTLDEVAKALGVTRERVRQIEKEALRKLRAEFFRAGLDPDDFLRS